MIESLRQELFEKGIAKLKPPFPDAVIADWNRRMDPLFKDRPIDRSYVTSDELNETGILDEFMNPAMRELIRGLVPDAVMYHCHVYEIAGNKNKPHIVGDVLKGWHRDTDVTQTPVQLGDCLSFFLYLSEVGERMSGPFELVPKKFAGRVERGMKSVKMMGPAGTFFIWNRKMLHRAAPNSSPVRRRLLKLSIQPNTAENQYIKQPAFEKVLNARAKNDEFIAFLFGKHFGEKRELPAAPSAGASFDVLPIETNDTVDISLLDTLKQKLRPEKPTMM